MSNKIMTGGEFFKDFTDAAKNHKGKETYKGFSESFSDTCLGIDAENPKRYMWFTGETENKTLTGSDVKDIVKNSFSDVSASLMTDVTINYDDNYQERKLIESIDKNKLSKYFSVVGFGGNSVSFDEYTWPDYSPNMSLIMSLDNHNYTAIKDWHLSGNGEDSYAMNQSNLIFSPNTTGDNNVIVNIKLKFEDCHTRYGIDESCKIKLVNNNEVEKIDLYDNDIIGNSWSLTFTGETTPNYFTSISNIGIENFRYTNTCTIKLENCYLDTCDAGLVYLRDIRTTSKSGDARVIDTSLVGIYSKIKYDINGSDITLTLYENASYGNDVDLYVEIPIQNTYLYIPINVVGDVHVKYRFGDIDNPIKRCQVSLFNITNGRTSFDFENYYENNTSADTYYVSGGLYNTRFGGTFGMREGGSINKNESGYLNNEFLTNEVGFYNADNDNPFTVTFYLLTPSENKKIYTFSGRDSIITKDLIEYLFNSNSSLVYVVGFSD